jgi:large repetitive protein
MEVTARRGTSTTTLVQRSLPILSRSASLRSRSSADRTTATIGEVVTYTVNVTVGEGTTNNVVLSDTLPTGVQFVAGSSQIISNPAGMTITGFDPDSVNQTLTIVNPGVNDRPDVVDSASFSISYDVVVLNVPSNQDFTILTNSVVATADDLPGEISDVSVTVTEPVLRIGKSVSDESPRLGEVVTYQISISHAGESTADAFDLVIFDVLPPNLTLDLTSVTVTSSVGATGLENSSSLNTFGFTVDRLEVGGTLTITYDALVTSDIGQYGSDNTNAANLTWTSRPGEDPNERTGDGGFNDYFDGTDVTVTIVGPDLSVTKDNGETVLEPGEQYTYTILVSNTDGPFSVTATNVIVVDDVPLGLTIIGTGGDDPIPVIDGQQVTFTLDSLDPGASAIFTITVQVDSPVAAGLEDVLNVVSVTHNDIDPTPDDNMASHPNLINAVPDLVITKESDVDVAAPGDSFTYTITLENVGNQDASGVTFVDVFPDAVLLFVFASDGGIFDPTTGEILFDIGDLGSGEVRTFTVEAQVRPIVPPGFVDFTNLVTASDDGSGGPDPTPENNTASDTIDLPAVPLFVIVKDDGLETVQPGQTFTYVITVQNIGNQGATGVQVVDVLPPELIFIDASDDGQYDPGLGEVTWLIGDLPDRSELVLTLTVQVPNDLRSFDTIFTNVATVFDDGTNSPDGQPITATDTDINELFFFAFDFFNNFSLPRREYPFEEPEFERPNLPIDAVFTGSADPGTTLHAVIYDEQGNAIGRQTVVADTGGNWLMTFPTTIIHKHSHRMEVVQTPAIPPHGMDSDHSLRRYFHPAVNGTLFFSNQETIAGVMRNQPSVVLNSMGDAAARPLATEWSLHRHDFRMSSVNPAER